MQIRAAKYGRSESARGKGIIDFGMGLTLREGDREYYYAAHHKDTFIVLMVRNFKII